jgi:O-antigen/teichoic acid export membrane protein
LFDLGLSRALTKLIAEKLGTKEEEQLPSLVWTGLGMMCGTGVLGAFLMGAISPWLASSALRVPPNLQHETLLVFCAISAAIPVVIVTAGLRGILEAQQLFGIVNAVRIPLGILTFVCPWVALLFTSSLSWAVLSLIAARVVALFAYFIAAIVSMPALRSNRSWQRSAVKPLVAFGGWMTVTNVLGPVMLYLDRFMIGSLLSVSAVAYYATPYDMVTKLLLIPISLTAVLFPAFATSSTDQEATIRLFRRGVNWILLALFPPVLMLVAFASPGLKLWLGNDFARNSSGVAQWLAIGVFINSLAQIPFALIQGVGRPDLTAKLHACELLVYLPLVYFLIRSYGVEGAAVAWLIRTLIDAILLFTIARLLSPKSNGVVLRAAAAATCSISVFLAAHFATGLALKISFSVFAFLVFLVAGWFCILAAEERSFLLKGIKLHPV